MDFQFVVNSMLIIYVLIVQNPLSIVFIFQVNGIMIIRDLFPWQRKTKHISCRISSIATYRNSDILFAFAPVG